MKIDLLLKSAHLCLVISTTCLAAHAADAGHSKLAALTQAARVAPLSDLAHYKLANALLAGGQKDAALAEYKKAYTLSQTEEMQSACRKALLFYRVQLPDNNNESLTRRIARAGLSQGTHASIDEFAAMTARSAGRQVIESDPNGVETFKQCPEIGGAIGESWQRWNQDFRLNFETKLKARLARLGVPAIYGRTKLVFSVDKNRRLRSRVVATSVAKPIWQAMLDITRTMDRSSELQFPSSSQIDGFNFAIGWTYPDPPMEVQQRLNALMRTNQTNAAIIPGTGMNAEALRLHPDQTATTAELSNVQGQLTRSSGGVGLQGQTLGLPGQTTGTGAAASTGKGLGVDAQVSGLIVPKPKMEELKAKTGKL